MKVRCVIIGVLMGIILNSTIQYIGDWYYNLWQDLYKEIEEA